MSPKEIFTQSSFWTLNLYIKSYIFCQHFILCVNQDQYPEYGSGFRRLLNTDPDPQHRLNLTIEKM